MKHRFPLLFAACALILPLAAGCSRDLVVEEVLQMPAHASVYTAYNLWHDDDLEIRSINTQKGRILPFGTEVDILKATDKETVFRTVRDNKVYTIEFEEEYRMQSPEEYLRTVFTLNRPDVLTEGMSPDVIEKIRRGIVEKGMSKAEVRLAYGPPCRFKTQSEILDTWLYWTDFIVGRRIVFNNDRVVEIIEL